MGLWDRPSSDSVAQEPKKRGLSEGESLQSPTSPPRKQKPTRCTQQYIWHSDRRSRKRLKLLQRKPLKTPFSQFLNPPPPSVQPVCTVHLCGVALEAPLLPGSLPVSLKQRRRCCAKFLRMAHDIFLLGSFTPMRGIGEICPTCQLWS